MPNNLIVNFKLPITAVDAMRTLVRETLAECKTKSQPEVWKTLTEEQRKAVNKKYNDCELLSSYFDM